MKVRLLQATPVPKTLMAFAASVCYDSIPREKIVDHCFDSGHHSILEHVVFTFQIEEVSRALSHQLVRHRHATFSQRSQRYCIEEDLTFVIPPSIANSEYQMRYSEAITEIKKLYLEMIAAGIPAEDARYLLPNASSTTLVMTINLRSLINFMGLRLCAKSQGEIKNLAKTIKGVVTTEFPELATYLTPKCTPLGYCNEKQCCGLSPTKREVLRTKK